MLHRNELKEAATVQNFLLLDCCCCLLLLSSVIVVVYRSFSSQLHYHYQYTIICISAAQRRSIKKLRTNERSQTACYVTAFNGGRDKDLQCSNDSILYYVFLVTFQRLMIINCLGGSIHTHTSLSVYDEIRCDGNWWSAASIFELDRIRFRFWKVRFFSSLGMWHPLNDPQITSFIFIRMRDNVAI